MVLIRWWLGKEGGRVEVLGFMEVGGLFWLFWSWLDVGDDLEFDLGVRMIL